MFGTIARARLKEGVSVDQLKAQFGDRDQPAGAVILLAYQSTKDPRDVWIVSAFENRDLYFKNADSPDQNTRYEKMVELLEGPPQWHDGEVLVAITEGKELARR